MNNGLEVPQDVRTMAWKFYRTHNNGLGLPYDVLILTWDFFNIHNNGLGFPQDKRNNRMGFP